MRRPTVAIECPCDLCDSYDVLECCVGCEQWVCSRCRDYTTWYGGDAQYVCQECQAADVDRPER